MAARLLHFSKKKSARPLSAGPKLLAFGSHCLVLLIDFGLVYTRLQIEA